MCNQWEENERKLLMDRPTDSSKAICHLFFKGGHNTATTEVVDFSGLLWWSLIELIWIS
jgi:hypothetical protein